MRQFVQFALLTIVVVAQAQPLRPEPGIWWGISPGQSVDERLQISATADGLAILSVPLAKTPVIWGPIAVATDGTIGFRHAGDRPDCIGYSASGKSGNA